MRTLRPKCKEVRDQQEQNNDFKERKSSGESGNPNGIDENDHTTRTPNKLAVVGHEIFHCVPPHTDGFEFMLGNS